MVNILRYSYKFNEVITLDKWKTTILTRIKKLIPDAKSNEGEKKKGHFESAGLGGL